MLTGDHDLPATRLGQTIVGDKGSIPAPASWTRPTRGPAIPTDERAL
ncbi:MULTISPECIES: hypothetical protein [unclassified Streptomyces]